MRRKGGMQACYPRREIIGQRRCAVCPRDHADRRDADLHGGQQLRWIVEQFQRHLRADIALVRHRLQARPAGRNDRHLGQRKNAVEQDKEKKDREFHRLRGQKGRVRVRAPGRAMASFCDTWPDHSTGLTGDG